MEYSADVWGNRVHYRKAGDGPPLVLVHGIASGSGAWLYNVPGLARHFTVYAPDLPGWADSPPLSGRPLTLELAGELLPAFMDAVGLERAPAVGWSMGGAVVMSAALRAPERLPRIALVASAGLGPEVHWTFRLAGLPLLGSLLTRPSRAGIERGIRRFYAHRWQGLTREYTEYLYRIALTPWARRSTLGVLRRYRVAVWGQRLVDQSGRLGELAMPVLLLWGEQDRVIPVRHAREALSRLPDGTLRVIPDAGHMVPAEDPETFNRHLIEFFTGITQQGPGG